MASLGLALFRREMPDLHRTARGEALLRSARVIEDAMSSFARQARGANTQLRGPITATMSVSMAVGLAPSIAAFARQWPEVILTVKTTTDRANLKAMEAHVAIRALPVGTPPDPSLVGRKTAVLNEAASGSDRVESWIASSDDPDGAAGTPSPDLLRNPRLKAFREAMFEAISAHAHQLRG